MSCSGLTKKGVKCRVRCTGTPYCWRHKVKDEVVDKVAVDAECLVCFETIGLGNYLICSHGHAICIDCEMATVVKTNILYCPLCTDPRSRQALLDCYAVNYFPDMKIGRTGISALMKHVDMFEAVEDRAAIAYRLFEVVERSSILSDPDFAAAFRLVLERFSGQDNARHIADRFRHLC